MDSAKEQENSSPKSKGICLRNELGFSAVISSLYQKPDITLKFSDGTISTHKGLLAAASPVFKTMLFGNFKEGNKPEVYLPADSCKTIQRIIDVIYQGHCEIDDLDDIISLMEVVERYQINKTPFLHMCGEAILSQLDSSNYLTLLPRYVSVMSEESHKKAADKVMGYTNNDFVSKFDETKDLPGEVLLLLLNRNDLASHEIDIFNFLEKWYDYQKDNTKNVFQLALKLFRCVRYSLIIPQLLSSVVARCPRVDKDLLCKAFEYLYSSCSPIGEADQSLSYCSRKPAYPLRVEWHAQQSVTIQSKKLDQCEVKIFYTKLQDDNSVIKSVLLRDGIYSFRISSITMCHESNYTPNFSIAIKNADGICLCKNMLAINNLIAVYIHKSFGFIKCIEESNKNRYRSNVPEKVRSTNSVDGRNPFSICIYFDGLQRNLRVPSSIVLRNMPKKEEPFITFYTEHVH